MKHLYIYNTYIMIFVMFVHLWLWGLYWKISIYGLCFWYQQEIQTLNTNLLSPVVIAILNVVLPFIFSFLPNIEMYREKNTGIQMTVFR